MISEKVRLRELEQKDAEAMLEWMHDEDLVKNLQTDFMKKTVDDCRAFIHNAQMDLFNLHFAVTDENDYYLGTVSLKNLLETEAEFGISMRRQAIGKGYALWAMKEMLAYGFTRLNLKKIFWCVSPENERAIRFYNKQGYRQVDYTKKVITGYSAEQIRKYVWYEVNKNEI